MDTMLQIVNLSTIVRKEGKVYVAWCPEADILLARKDFEGALADVCEAVELYLEDDDAQVPRGA